MKSNIRYVNALAAAKERREAGLPARTESDVLRAIVVLAHRALVASYDLNPDGTNLNHTLSRIQAILNDIADTAALRLADTEGKV